SATGPVRRWCTNEPKTVLDGSLARRPVRSRPCPPDAELVDRRDVEVGMPAHRAGRLEIGEVWRQLAEHRPQLPPGEVGAEAEVLAEAEREVVVRVTADVEAIRIGELALV